MKDSKDKKLATPVPSVNESQTTKERKGATEKQAKEQTEFETEHSSNKD